MFKKTYGTARGLLLLLSVLGWLAVIAGIIILLGMLPERRDDMSFWLMLPSALATIVSGLILTALALVGEAVLDQADISQKMLLFLRRRDGTDADQPSEVTRYEEGSRAERRSPYPDNTWHGNIFSIEVSKSAKKMAATSSMASSS